MLDVCIIMLAQCGEKLHLVSGCSPFWGLAANNQVAAKIYPRMFVVLLLLINSVKQPRNFQRLEADTQAGTCSLHKLGALTDSSVTSMLNHEYLRLPL